MPPRKSDSARLSNVSMAQFVYDGSDADTSSTSLRPVPAAPAAAAAQAAATLAAARAKPTPSIEMDSHRPAEAAPPADKDKKESKENGAKDSVSIEDLNLPKSIITRLAKGVLPPNTQIQANGILAMSKSATVFINHLANAANERTQASNKKTIMPADVFNALETIEFDFMRERLEAEFQKFNEVQTTKRNTYRRKVAAAKKAEKAAASQEDPNASIVSTSTVATTNAPRASKKQKPNAPDDSAMDIDGADATEELRDQSDAETDP
ncbi:histone-fold-containing protein [Hypoxylon trugodes]|uniref:histone-fold-containing protein n=1 Tax=Hypoxylon trugodes TaxID=326681 RepID=UPI002196360B|nr:histone-fold-containing protein [Hypoxylon trugodes]KAI1383108.1 histone-fold-containing protein [Hypoxylon trugodes]